MAIRQFDVPGEAVAEALDHRLHRPVLPEEGVAPAGAEVRDAQVGQLLQPLDLLPEPGHRPGVEHLELELLHLVEDRPRAQLHQHGEGRDLPHHRLGPRALEGEVVLVADAVEPVVGHLEVVEPRHEVRPEHPALAVEGVAAQPGDLAAAEAQAADVVELGADVLLGDELGERHVGRAVDQAELDGDVAVTPEDRLQHQELVEVGVEQRPDDRVDPPVVVVDAGGDVGHGAQAMLGAARRRRRPPAHPGEGGGVGAVEVDLARRRPRSG